jgi:transcriptional regulatory protein RtcR
VLASRNCATIRSDAAHSLLFGHEKGAFTGALQARSGLSCTAHTGLLLLDEIDELELAEVIRCIRRRSTLSAAGC